MPDNRKATIIETPSAAIRRMVSTRFKVLVVDDSPDDKFLMARGLTRSCCLDVVGSLDSGDMARNYLGGRGVYANRVLHPFPDLLLTDLDMPNTGGLELLSWIKSMHFSALRVVVLSATPDPEKIARVLALGVDYFQAKSSDLVEISAFVHRLELLMVLLAQRDQPKAKPSGNIMNANTTLALVDGRAPPWDIKIRAAADSKRNFLLILHTELDLEKLWAVLGTTTIVPDRLHRWGALAMADALSEQDYTTLLEIYRTQCIYLVEQLTLTRNVPPLTKAIILYCELRGIISEHDTVEEAGLALLDYLNGFTKARLLPLAGIYEYKGTKWVRVKKLTSD